MFGWPGNDRKKTLHINYNVKFSKGSLDVGRGFLFPFGVI